MEAKGRWTAKSRLHQQTTPVCLTATKTITTSISGTQATPKSPSTTCHHGRMKTRSHGAITTNKAQNLKEFIKEVTQGIQTLHPTHPSVLNMKVVLPAVHAPPQVHPLTWSPLAEKINQSFFSAVPTPEDSRNSREAPVTPRDMAHHHLPLLQHLTLVKNPGPQRLKTERPQARDTPPTADRKPTGLRRSLKSELRVTSQ